MPATANKQEFYKELALELSGLLSGERDAVANAANMSALLYHSLAEVNWVGFYFLKGGELVVGPFQGKPACVRIALGRGVCGTAAASAAFGGGAGRARVSRPHRLRRGIAVGTGGAADFGGRGCGRARSRQPVARTVRRGRSGGLRAAGGDLFGGVEGGLVAVRTPLPRRGELPGNLSQFSVTHSAPCGRAPVSAHCVSERRPQGAGCGLTANSTNSGVRSLGAAGRGTECHFSQG
jgi:hypothetical protein